MTLQQDRITIAILALGGQGGGVLAEWIQDVARGRGWLAQGTSVPGVAQRTGSTVYYVELAKPGLEGKLPVMAQMPMPGDVDIVIASELMETGRALLRGFSTAGRTVLIGSTHRVYAISEKSALSDGRGSSDRIIEAAHQRSARFIGFDMEAATDRADSVISAVMFGALAGAGVLPFVREDFEEAIRASGIAVPSNLAGFAEGQAEAQKPVAMPGTLVHADPVPSTPAGRALAERIARQLPQEARSHALHGVARLMDFQDAAYAGTYLDRLERIAALDAAPFVLTSELARHLALWMSYDDTIRVADLKTRAGRFGRIRGEVKASDGQLLSVTEYMHPRLQELGETLPVPLGRALLSPRGPGRWLARFFNKGRHVRTSGLFWFLTLRMVAAMRPLRPRSLRWAEEQQRIDDWLVLVERAAREDRGQAAELVQCQRLIKGYGDTFERGLGNFRTIMARHQAAPLGAESLRRLREAALADDKGEALGAALGELQPAG